MVPRLILTLLLCSAFCRGEDAIADAAAKFLAGLPLPAGSPLEARASEPEWTGHAAEFNHAWTQLEARQLAKIRAWAPVYLAGTYEDRGPMFYMFSGPDFLYAQAFFPNAATYILCGTEPVGAVPDLEKMPRAALGSGLANLRKSLDSLLSWSFFITKNMKVDLTQTQLSGTLPVLFVFLARSGCRIDAVQFVTLDNSGTMTAGKGKSGVKIDFFGPSGRGQTLYYFTTDLADDGIRRSPGFMRFCDRQGSGPSLLKAASYLMHEKSFSQVRDFLLTHSKTLLQDDSGIPLRYFAKEKWQLRFLGKYTGPIELFKQYPQPDLAAAYATSVPPPIPFGFGYQWQPSRSSLLIAVPR